MDAVPVIDVFAVRYNGALIERVKVAWNASDGSRVACHRSAGHALGQGVLKTPGLGTSGAKLIESVALNPGARTFRRRVRLGWRRAPQRKSTHERAGL